MEESIHIPKGRRHKVGGASGRNTADPKDGYSVRDLKDPEIQMVIGFVNPIFHPNNPKRLVSLWASTFIGCFREKLEVD